MEFIHLSSSSSAFGSISSFSSLKPFCTNSKLPLPKGIRQLKDGARLARATCSPVIGVVILKHRKRISCKGRLQDDGKEFTNSEDAKVEELDVLDSLPMENIPKSLWPLLMSAAEAAAKSDGALTKSISQAAQGVSTWRELLSKGRIWRDEDGANWPQDNTLRSGWQNLLRDKGLPHLVKKYPKLVDPLLASLLETVEQFHQELDEMEDSNEETDPQDEEEEQEDEANNPSTPSDTNDESEDAAADTEDIESSTASTNEVNGDDTEDADTSEREALAEKLMDQLSEQLGDDLVKVKDNGLIL
eukprot:symbB.v1.2.022061.t1/scaffold1941.1/size95522/7